MNLDEVRWDFEQNDSRIYINTGLIGHTCRTDRSVFE